MMRPRTPILATLTATLALSVPAWPLAARVDPEVREIPQQVQDGRRLLIDTRDRVSPLSTTGPRAYQTPAAASSAHQLTAVRHAREATDVLLTLEGDGRLTASAVLVPDAAPARLVLDFAGVEPKVPTTTAVNAGLVRRVRVARHSASPLVTRVVVDLSGTFLYKVRPAADQKSLVITIGDPAQRARRDDEAESRAFASVASPAATRAAAPRTPAPVVSNASATTGAPAAAPAAPPAESRPRPAARRATPPPAPAARPAAPPTPAAQVLQPVALPNGQAMAEGRYSGHPISLDFQGVDLRAVLRTFAEVTGLNLVIDPGVKGTVDVTLRDVPWDQALEMILRANQLAYSVDGTIVRIAPTNTFAAEAADRRKQAEERMRELAVSKKEFRTVRLNYANAKDLADLVKKTGLTSFGDVQVDVNTNALILFDISDGLTKAMKLIGELDRPQLQVEIEARIVRTTKSTARELGMLWGFGGAMTPELGNTTNLAFPNSIRSGGVAGAVSTSVDNAFIKLGTVNGAFNLDVALSALESSGKVDIMLRPRVVTQNNIRATITRGQEIPYTTLTAPPVGEGVSVIQPVPQVQFKTAALTLNVTPRITEADTVILDVDVDNGSPGPVEINGNRSINTQRVTTRVLVADQGTTVIGGINEESSQMAQDRTPGLHRLPFLGRLFKRDTLTADEGELLIFISPRIIRDGGPVK